jgi:hypothetical protein
MSKILFAILIYLTPQCLLFAELPFAADTIPVLERASSLIGITDKVWMIRQTNNAQLLRVRFGEILKSETKEDNIIYILHDLYLSKKQPASEFLSAAIFAIGPLTYEDKKSWNVSRYSPVYFLTHGELGIVKGDLRIKELNLYLSSTVRTDWIDRNLLSQDSLLQRSAMIAMHELGDAPTSISAFEKILGSSGRIEEKELSMDLISSYLPLPEAMNALLRVSENRMIPTTLRFQALEALPLETRNEKIYTWIQSTDPIIAEYASQFKKRIEQQRLAADLDLNRFLKLPSGEQIRTIEELFPKDSPNIDLLITISKNGTVPQSVRLFAIGQLTLHETDASIDALSDIASKEQELDLVRKDALLGLSRIGTTIAKQKLAEIAKTTKNRDMKLLAEELSH